MDDDNSKSATSSASYITKSKPGSNANKVFPAIKKSGSANTIKSMNTSALSLFRSILFGGESSTHRVREEEPLKRPYYRMRPDYYIMLFAGALGMGNALSFPAAAFSYGRGTFILVYSIVNIFVGIPLIYLEVSWGQFSNRGPIEAYRRAPLFKGIGLSAVLATLFDEVVYPVKVVYTGSYIFAGSARPFSSCENYWNTHACVMMDKCSKSRNESLYPNGSCYSMDNHFLGVWNITAFETTTNISVRTPGYEYLRYYVQGNNSTMLSSSSDIEVLLLVGLISIWFCSFVCLQLGIRTMPKVMIVQVCLPQIMLLYLFIRTIALKGDDKITEYFLTLPTLKELKVSKMYSTAFQRVFYSLGIGYGIITTLASYNRPRQSILRPIIAVTLLDLWTSLMMGMIVFSFIWDTNPHLLQKLGGGESLVFELYALTSSSVDKGALLTATFFTALTVMGIGPIIATLCVILSAFEDNWPTLLARKGLLVGVVCVSLCLLGIPFVTKHGHFLMTFYESYACYYTPFLITFFNLFVVFFVYGFKRYEDDLEMMLGKQPPRWVKYSWQILLVVFSAFITWKLIMDWTDTPEKPGPDMVVALNLYGTVFGKMFGWAIYLAPLLCVPIVMIVKILQRPKEETFFKRVEHLLAPSASWLATTPVTPEESSQAPSKGKTAYDPPSTIREDTRSLSSFRSMMQANSSDSTATYQSRRSIIQSTTISSINQPSAPGRVRVSVPVTAIKGIID